MDTGRERCPGRCNPVTIYKTRIDTGVVYTLGDKGLRQYVVSCSLSVILQNLHFNLPTRQDPAAYSSYPKTFGLSIGYPLPRKTFSAL